MILHFSHIGLTDGRTFMIPFGFGPDGVALVAGTATATMPPERTFAHRTHLGPSATKQNTKRLRRTMSRAVAASIIALQAIFCALPATGAAGEPPPILVHAGAELHPAASVAGSGIPGTRGAAPAPVVYARRSGGWQQYWLWFEDNTQDRGILRSGRHAGDWEMVQYRLDGSEAV